MPGNEARKGSNVYLGMRLEKCVEDIQNLLEEKLGERVDWYGREHTK